MITHLLIYLGEPDVDDGFIVVRFIGVGIAGNQRGKVTGNIRYQFGATNAAKQTALTNRVKAEIADQYPASSFSPSLIVEFL